MVFLQRTNPPNPRKRPVPTPDPNPNSNPNPSSNGGDMATMISTLAAAGCTLHPSAPPSLPSDPHRLRRHLSSHFLSSPSLLPPFLTSLSSFLPRPLLLSSPAGPTLLRHLLLVPPLQPPLLQTLLHLLPNHFDNDDVARLILAQLRYLDFIVDPDALSEKLMEVLSIAPPNLKKEIIGSLPEIIGDRCHATVVSALERLLREDSEVIVPVLDSFSNLNLDDQLQEQV